MLTVIVLILTTVFSVFPAGAVQMEQVSNRIAVVYDNKNGLPSSEANTVCQTEAGYVWIGSYAGLVRYDGKRFQNLCETENICAGIRALYETADGSLWIGTNDEGVYCYRNSEFVPCLQSDGTPLPSVRSFAQLPDGSVYAGTTGGLFLYTDGCFEPILADHMSEAVDYLAVDSFGTLWGCGSAASIFAYRDGEVLRYWKTEDFFCDDYKMLAVQDEWVYVGTFGNKVVGLQLTDDTYTDASIKTSVFTTDSLSTINAIYPAADGRIWIGADNGAGYLDADRVIHTDEELLECAGVSHIMEDYEGNLWIASTKKGVYKISGGRFYHDRMSEGRSVNATAITHDVTFIGTDTGLITLDAERNNTIIPGLESLHNIRIRDVVTDSKGFVWICTYSDLGLFCYDTNTGEVKVFTEAEGLLNSLTRKAVELSDGRMAILTYHGINFIKDGVVLKEHFGAAEGISALPVLCLAETSDNTIYAGTDGDGLYSIRNGDLKKETDGCLSGLSVVLAMAPDPSGSGVWFSSGSDVYFVDSNGSTRVLPKFTQGVGSVFDIIFHNDAVYFTKTEGVYCVDRQAMLDGESTEAVRYGIKDGLRGGLNANSRSVIYEGTLFLAASEGMNIFVLEGKADEQLPPKVYINSIEAQYENGEEEFSYIPEEGKQSITIPSDTRRLVIRFACLSFTGKEYTLAYKLSGFDQTETRIISSDESTATYTNLPGGEYVFHLTAISDSGEESEIPVVLTINKELTLWERGWVRALAVIGIVLLASLFFWYKLRKSRREQERYRTITHQSLETIANTIDAKDSYTKGHSVRVATYARELARRLDLSKREQEDIYFIALLHDIGKIGTPDAILNKPGKLTEEEFAVIRNHTVDGAGILSKFTIIPNIWKGARWHHERVDGKGYPDGKEGDDIPYLARIICVADAFDAMSSNRPYRNAMDMEKIVDELRNCSGTQFQPEIVDCMVDYIRDEEKKAVR